MSLTLVVEDGTGRANANAFIDYATATTLLEASPYAGEWASVLQPKADQCIAEASAWISRAPWDGIATYEAQGLAWPRAWMKTRDGYAIASNLIPLFLKQATARLAYWLSQQATSPYVDTGLQPGTEIELASGLRLTPASGAVFPPDVRALIADYLRTGSRVRRA